MADDLAIARRANARPQSIFGSDLGAPLHERVIQIGSRWAGASAYFVALGGLAYWLLG